ncbi:E3 ubiquitin-protein ligase RFI2 [Lactuca sativa]|uniref:E3 ubiquitin-protein ligase RFI2 n=1 Tax=Lactuca sativa TaxID=4236 RepID=UPI000CB27A51|nr:E3 ubiquitin-protein ligase RFI2 [Lactuca sativa]
MVASKITDVINADVADNASPALGCSSSVPCSICFDLVIDEGERSTAKLQCGHKFHLDCIGSAFNSKGTMQCPNCRKVESGRWLFADAISETSARDWMPNEGPHDLSYSRRPFGFHWCPFSGFTVHSSIEESEPSLNTFTNFQANHPMIIDHTPSAPSYISYFQPSEHANNFHHPLNSISTPRATNIQHPAWGWNCHFLPYNADRDHGIPATLRSTSFLHPLHYNTQQRLRMVLPAVSNRGNHDGRRGFYIHEHEHEHEQSSYNSYYRTHEREYDSSHVPIMNNPWGSGSGSFHHRTHWS